MLISYVVAVAYWSWFCLKSGLRKCEIDFHLQFFGNGRRTVSVCLFVRFILPNLPLRLNPVSNCLTIATASLLVQFFIGSLGDLRCKIPRCLGFDWIENPIREQFQAVIHEEPYQRISPNEQCPTPAEGCHKQPINRYQRRHDLRPQHGPTIKSARDGWTRMGRACASEK